MQYLSINKQKNRSNKKKYFNLILWLQLIIFIIYWLVDYFFDNHLLYKITRGQVDFDMFATLTSEQHQETA